MSGGKPHDWSYQGDQLRFCLDILDTGEGHH